MYFLNDTSAETFRTRMAHHKTGQQKMLESLGIAVEDERTVLKFSTKKGESGEDVVAYVQFALPSPLKKYPVMILDEGDLDGQKV